MTCPKRSKPNFIHHYISITPMDADGLPRHLWLINYRMQKHSLRARPTWKSHNPHLNRHFWERPKFWRVITSVCPNQVSSCYLGDGEAHFLMGDHFGFSSPRIAVHSVTYHEYESEKPLTVMNSVALLLHHIYSSYWGHMEALCILFRWGYGSPISD